VRCYLRIPPEDATTRRTLLLPVRHLLPPAAVFDLPTRATQLPPTTTTRNTPLPHAFFCSGRYHTLNRPVIPTYPFWFIRDGPTRKTGAVNGRCCWAFVLANRRYPTTLPTTLLDYDGRFGYHTRLRYLTTRDYLDCARPLHLTHNLPRPPPPYAATPPFHLVTACLLYFSMLGLSGRTTVHERKQL